MLEIQNVSKTFNAGTVNQKTALNGLNLKLNEGDFVTVIGGNGAGKSTMLNAVAGVWPVDEGKILIDGPGIKGFGNILDLKHSWHPLSVLSWLRVLQSIFLSNTAPPGRWQRRKR